MPWNAESFERSRARTFTGRGVHLGHLALLYLVFAGLFLLTALFFSQGRVEKEFHLDTPEGGLVPIEVKNDETVYEVTIASDLIPVNSWAFIEGQVLDADKEYLFSFGDELSYYTGRDSEGRWTERKNSYSAKLTIPKAGNYFLSFVTETSRGGDTGAIVVVRKLRGSSLPFMLAGAVAFIIAVVLNEIRNGTITKIIEALEDD